MGLRVRFTLFFSGLMLALLGAFAVLVYAQMRNKLLSTAQQTLMSHLEHEFHHVAATHGTTSTPAPVHREHLKGMNQRVWRNDVLVEDSFPTGTEVSEPALVALLENKIVAKLERPHDGHRIKIVAYYDLSGTLSYLSTLRKILAVACLLGLLLVIPLSYVSTKLLLRPFRRLSDVAAELDAQKLSFRFQDSPLRDEYGVLVRTFNSLLKRLENSFSQTRRFATNASHELKTPLAVIISQGEKALRKQRSDEEYRAAIEKMLSHARTLNRITERLLMLADIESASQDTQRAPILLAPTIEEVVQSLKVTSPGRQKAVIVEGATAQKFRGNLPTFVSIVTNLVENALKYSRSQVVVKVQKSAETLRLDFEDDGPGIPFDKRDRVFEPFYHDSLGTSVKGHGLGLAIVKSCVESHQGSIELGDSSLGGLSVTVFLPEST